MAATAHTERDTGLNLKHVCDLEPYWEALRKGIRTVRIRAGRTARTRLHPRDSRRAALQPEPASQRAGPGDRFEDVEEAYASADRLLGCLIKVTPSSKVIGDLALRLVGAGVSVDDFAAEPGRFDIPDSVMWSDSAR